MAEYLFPGHKCQLNTVRSETYLPGLLPTASWGEKLLRWTHKSIMVSRRNPITARYFSSQAAIAKENRRLKKLPYYIIHPCSVFSALWYVMVILTYAIDLSVIPVIIVFYEHLHVSGNFVVLLIDGATSAILYLEIVVKIHTSYYDHKEETFVLSKSLIRKKYLRSTLFPDIIAAFPTLLLLKYYWQYKEFRLEVMAIFFVCFLLNFLNIPKILRYYRVISVYYDLSTTSDLMIKLGIGSLYILHIVALANIILAEYIALDKTEKWTDWNRISLEIKYAISFLYALQGFIGCGFEDLSDAPIYYKYYNIVSVFCGWIFQALMVALLLKALTSSNQSESVYNEFMREVKIYCHKYKLTDNLPANIYKYIDRKFRDMFFNEDHIYQTLSGRLKADITMEHCKNLLGQVEIFKKLPRSVILQIMRHLTMEIYLPGQIIIKVNTVGDKMFFLESGSAIVVSELGTQIGMFEDGSYFGEIALLIENKKRNASVIAVELCETYILSKTDFLMAVEQNSDLFKQMQSIALERIREVDRLSRLSEII